MAVKKVQERQGSTTSSTSEQIGFHKGSLTTLLKEREELARLLTIVEQLVRMHTSALKDLGVDLASEAKQPAKKRPIEDILK